MASRNQSFLILILFSILFLQFAACSGSSGGKKISLADEEIITSGIVTNNSELHLKGKTSKLAISANTFQEEMEVKLSEIENIYPNDGLIVSKTILLEFSKAQPGMMNLEIDLSNEINAEKFKSFMKSSPFKDNQDFFLLAMTKKEGEKINVGTSISDDWIEAFGEIDESMKKISIPIRTSAEKIYVTVVLRNDLLIGISESKEDESASKTRSIIPNIIRNAHAAGDPSWADIPWAIACDIEAQTMEELRSRCRFNKWPEIQELFQETAKRYSDMGFKEFIFPPLTSHLGSSIQNSWRLTSLGTETIAMPCFIIDEETQICPEPTPPDPALSMEHYIALISEPNTCSENEEITPRACYAPGEFIAIVENTLNDTRMRLHSTIGHEEGHAMQFGYMPQLFFVTSQNDDVEYRYHWLIESTATALGLYIAGYDVTKQPTRGWNEWGIRDWRYPMGMWADYNSPLKRVPYMVYEYWGERNNGNLEHMHELFKFWSAEFKMDNSLEFANAGVKKVFPESSIPSFFLNEFLLTRDGRSGYPYCEDPIELWIDMLEPLDGKIYPMSSVCYHFTQDVDSDDLEIFVDLETISETQKLIVDGEVYHKTARRDVEEEDIYVQVVDIRLEDGLEMVPYFLNVELMEKTNELPICEPTRIHKFCSTTYEDEDAVRDDRRTSSCTSKYQIFQGGQWGTIMNCNNGVRFGGPDEAASCDNKRLQQKCPGLVNALKNWGGIGGVINFFTITVDGEEIEMWEPGSTTVIQPSTSATGCLEACTEPNQ